MDDSVLLSLLHNSDKNAYKQLFIKYFSPLTEYASQFVSDDDAEELVQELMLYIWENREELFIEKSLKSYLFAAIRFRCLNAIKKRQYQEQIHSLIYEKIKDQFEDPDYYMVNELVYLIRKAVDELPETYRKTFMLSRFGVRTNVQIAKELDISIKTVEYHIRQSLKIMRIKLKDYLPLLLISFGIG